MTGLKIPHNAFVFVGDGRKALFLRNEGDEKFPNLKTESVFQDDNPPTHEQGSERPGRLSKALDSGQRSAVEPVDWHHIEEHRFTRKVAAAMGRWCGRGKSERSSSLRLPRRSPICAMRFTPTSGHASSPKSTRT